MELTREILDELKKPFPEVKWRAGAKYEGEAMALAYIESRDVMDRLDEVVEGNWEFRCHPEGTWGSLTVCGVTREDVGVAGEGGYATRKAAASDTLKRCAVHFGIGRYLYRFPAQWLPYDGKKFTKPPQAPQWAIQKHDPKTQLDDFVERVTRHYKHLSEAATRQIIGDAKWTGDNEQRKEVHKRLKARDNELRDNVS